MVVAYIGPGRRELPGIHFDLAIPILWGLQTVWKNPSGLTLSHRGQLVSQMVPYQDSVTSSTSSSSSSSQESQGISRARGGLKKNATTRILTVLKP